MKNNIFILICSLVYLSSFAQSTATSGGASYNIQKKIEPPLLEFAELPSFVDADGNNAINANEKCRIVFKLRNTGKGDGLNLKVLLAASGSTTGLTFSTSTAIKNVPKLGGLQTYELPITSNMNTVDGNVDFTVEVQEPLGFGTEKVSIEMNTRKFLAPNVKVVDFAIVSVSGSTNLEKKKTFSLQLLVQNLGQGIAKDVVLNLNVPADVFMTEGLAIEKLGSIMPGEKRSVEYQMIMNNNYAQSSLPITAKLSESYKLYAENWTQSFPLNQALAQQKIIVQASAEQKIDIVEASLRSDVDKNIPNNSTKDENKFALIIGNEDYKSQQPGLSDEINVEFASNDATVFKEYCQKTFGVPDANIIFLLNATAGKMSQAIDKLNLLIKAKNGEANVIVYYAGHGLPDEISKVPYLIPVDVSGSNISSGIKLSYLYNKLTEFPSKQVTVFLDACFTGGGREAGLLAARGVKVTPKQDAIKGNIVVFTASSGDQSSLPWKEKQHGMFTYFLLKKFQENNGNFYFEDLDNFLRDKVTLESVRVNSKMQNPQLLKSTETEINWKELKLNY
jgi:hypothetical protein